MKASIYTRPNKHCLPNPEQTLLLKASLFEGEKALAAWDECVQYINLDTLDHRSYRLLPLLYKNLLKHKISSSYYGRIRGVYKRTWVRNQLLFRDLTTVVQSLHLENINVLLLKGAALTLQLYKDYGLRPMSDIDILIPNKHVKDAINVIEQNGWKPKNPIIGHNPLYHATEFINSKGNELDLHWQVLYLDATKDYEDTYWKRSDEILLANVLVKVPSLTDQLIQACIHGYRWDPYPPLRWIVDSYFILQTSNIDWGYLVDHSKQLGASIFMSHALKYLKDEYHLAIPESVIEAIEIKPITLNDRWQYWVFISKPMPVFGTLFREFFRYYTYHSKKYPFPGFIRYLQVRWSVKSLWQVPLEAILRGVRRFAVDVLDQKPETTSKPSVFQKNPPQS